MRFLHSMVRVKDLDASLHFYCDLLGLKEKTRKDSEKGRFTLVFLYAPEDEGHVNQSSSPLIELTYNWPNEEGSEDYSNGRNFGHLAFQVNDIYKTCEHLQSNGVEILRPPRDGRMAFIKSPDQISIELLQKGDALPPQSPWNEMKNKGSW